MFGIISLAVWIIIKSLYKLETIKDRLIGTIV